MKALNISTQTELSRRSFFAQSRCRVQLAVEQG